MRVLYLTDRLSDRGGADHHLARVVTDAVSMGHRATVAYGRDEGGAVLPPGVERRCVPGLAARTASAARLGDLDGLLDRTELIHAQNVMNPIALARAVSRDRVVVTVQDHRFFCPGRGKTMPDGSLCSSAMSDRICRECLRDDGYRRSTLELTRQRLEAVASAQLVVLSRYMASELRAVGIDRVQVIPPWVEVGEPRATAGSSVMMGGRLVTHKAVLDGWRAWRRAGTPLPMVVAGAGPLETALEGANVLGWLAAEVLVETLRRARMLLFPAEWQEPFGILGLEALAQGTPVVVADSGGTAEWSDEGCVTALPGNVEAMAEAIGDLAEDPEAALLLGRAGQRAVGERFARVRIVPMLADLYRAVAGA